MVYIYKEYKHIFDTPAKKQQERVIVTKIMDLLNKNKYDDIYEFINKNKTYQDFLKNNELENVVKHFGNTLNEQDFINIQNEMVKLTEKKKDYEKESIQTTNIDDKEYNSYKGESKTFFLDNSNSDMSIQRQMDELQKTNEAFQTSNSNQNTENMMRELEQSKKESLNLKYLNEINVYNLNDVQKETFNAANRYQESIGNPIRVDIDRQLIVDQFDNIMKIQKTNNEINIIGDENHQKDSIESQEITMEKSFQKILTPSLNTIYSSNN